MTLLNSQTNQLLGLVITAGLNPIDFTGKPDSYWSGGRLPLYHRDYRGTDFKFTLYRDWETEAYKVHVRPGLGNPDLAITKADGWRTVLRKFQQWLDSIKKEVEVPDLWLEASKAVQLFAPAADLAADKFTIAELGAVHGQLRMLKQLLEASELLRDCRAELAELTQTAAVKAEVFTKKDWQNWMKGAFGSCVTSLALSETQAQELLALVRLAFGGLFLNQ